MFAHLTLCVPLALSASPFQETDGTPVWTSPFPASSPIAEGVSPEATQALDELVQGLVDGGEVVGAEVLVLVGGRAILHEAYGWADRESERPLERGSVYCVRSMTKPLIGTATLMALQEGLLELDTPVAEHLDGFATPELEGITVEHLLTHTSGMPMSYLLGEDLEALEGIAAVANLTVERGLRHGVGERFEYSDQGTDTLTALLEAASGMGAAEFVETRLLAPIGMDESLTTFPSDHPLRARAVTKYAGGAGFWEPYWTPADEALFPFFLGSQGLYSTITDYALFCEFWAARGRTPSERLIKPLWVRKALEPRSAPLGVGSGFPGLDSDYGWLMSLYTEERPAKREGRDPEREVVVFGHTGSDGTHAWVFPEQKAVALYFTQSRGTTTGPRVEEALARMFLGAPFDPNAVAPPIEPYLGYYREAEDDLYRSIVRDGDRMALEINGRVVVPLVWAGDDRWKLEPEPASVIEFQRDENGVVTGFEVGGNQEYRFEPSADLPDGEQLAARVRERHGLERLAEAGTLRRTGTMSIPNLQRSATVETLMAWPDRYRRDTASDQDDSAEAVSIDGDTAWVWSTVQEREESTGPELEAILQDHPFAHFGDWQRWYDDVTVIQRIDEEDGDSGYVVRMGGLDAPAPTLMVDAETATVIGVHTMTTIPGMGRMGQKTRFSDYREIAGTLLPHAIDVTLANPLIGVIELRFDAHESGVEVAPGTFGLEELR